MNDYLYHHGVMGMKWGVRRYQNKDGSLTEAGKKKYNYTSHKTKRMNKKAEKSLKKESEKTELLKKRAKASQDFDDLQVDYAKSTSAGKVFVRNWLLAGGRNKTYNMARSMGYGRAKAMVKSILDIRLFYLGGPSLNQSRMRKKYIKSKVNDNIVKT